MPPSTNPETLRPGRTSTAVTQEAAQHFAGIADAIRQRGLDPAVVAHFLDRIVFCLFAEDTGLLPDKVFSRIVEKSGGDPARFGKILAQLFDTMATGGDFGLEPIRHFNGNLFDDRTVIALTPDEVKRIAIAASLDWSAVDPSIFGTLFERGLDPAKRSQLGAHFTSKEDIELVVDAVVMAVLRREWDESRQIIERLLTTGKKTPPREGTGTPLKPLTAPVLKKARLEAASILHRFLDRLQTVKILDPACGSGNFLYVALLRLKDLEKEAILYGSDNGLGAFLPLCGPWQLYGIEINPYAHDLAQMTVWIGWLQWIRSNGFGFPADPVLRPLSENIRLMDAIMKEVSGVGCQVPSVEDPEWPKVDFIIGNPPFLGGKILRRELGDTYVDRLFAVWGDRVPAEADLCCYWFEKARAHIAAGTCKRAGLLATQGIRGGANREVLKRIKDSGGIFWAESDRPWILNGANVHVSMVGFDDGEEKTLTLDGKVAPSINANLTAMIDITTVAVLPANSRLSFMGITPAAPFDLPCSRATEWLHAPNPHGRPNSDVLRPYFNGEDLNKRARGVWTIDFGVDRDVAAAALYAAPFDFLNDTVRPIRSKNARENYRAKWWLYAESRSGMRSAITGLGRYVATCMVAKHRIFVWLDATSLPANVVIAFARSDDYFFGVLHSRFHEIWSLKLGTRLETRPRYTPTTCFETFPFPETHVERDAAIAVAAKELNELREGWLNPPEWTRTEILEFPGTVGGPWDRYIDPATVQDRGSPSQSSGAASAFKVGTVRYPRLVARDTDCAVRLKVRTLTKLYNERPAWLADCHAKLDAAVAAAYGWTVDLTDDQILSRLLELNLARSASVRQE